MTGLKSSGSGCCCPTRQTSVSPRHRRMPSRCRHAGRRNRRSMPSGPRTKLRGKTTSSRLDLSGPSSMPVTLSGTASRRKSISPRTTRSGTTWARRRQRRRLNTPRTRPNRGTIPGATSWTPSRSRCLRYGCLCSRSRQQDIPEHIRPTRPSLGCKGHQLVRRQTPQLPGRRNHTSTSHGSPLRQRPARIPQRSPRIRLRSILIKHLRPCDSHNLINHRSRPRRLSRHTSIMYSLSRTVHNSGRLLLSRSSNTSPLARQLSRRAHRHRIRRIVSRPSEVVMDSRSFLA